MTTSQELLDMLAEKSEIVDKEHFGFVVNEGNEDRWLNPTLPVLWSIGHLTNNTKLILKLKFFAKSPRQLTDPKAIHLYYIQVQHDLINEILPCTYDQALFFASFQLQASFGNHDPQKHKQGFLDTVGVATFVPPFVTKKSRPWQKKLFGLHAGLAGQSQTEAELKYLDMASKLPRYGFTYFLVEDSNGEVYLGLSKPGITLSKKSSVQIPVKSKIRKSKQSLFRFEDILSWKSESSTVELSIRTENNGKVTTKEIILFAKSILQSTTIVDLINGYYKLRNMYNNDSIGVSSTPTINKIQTKFQDSDARLAVSPALNVESKLSSSPASPAKSDLSDNKNNIQAYFDEEFEDEEEDEGDEDDKDEKDEKDETT